MVIKPAQATRVAGVVKSTAKAAQLYVDAATTPQPSPAHAVVEQEALAPATRAVTNVIVAIASNKLATTTTRTAGV